MMVIVKKPSVNVALAQSRLDSGEIHGQMTILNKSEELGESEDGRGKEEWHSANYQYRTRALLSDANH